MKPKPAAWEEPAPGVKVLKMWKTDLNPDWPRVLILDLTAERFREFQQDPLGFDKRYKLFPDQPMLWISHCSMPPRGRGIPEATKLSRWTVVVPHTKVSIGTCAACPQTTTP